MEIEKLTTREYWDDLHDKFNPFTVKRVEFSHIIDKLLPVNSDFTCVEIGAYFGRYLSYMAKKFKYKVTAIEFSKDTDHIAQMLEFNGIKDYEIINRDFFEIKDLKFNVVSSFGFIEHFDDYETVLRAHFDMLEPGGYLVLGIPAWGGLHHHISTLFCVKEQIPSIYATHNLKIMNLKEVKRVLTEFPCEMLFCNYTCGSEVWFGWQDSFIKKRMRYPAYLLKQFNRFIGRWLPSTGLYSPTMLVIARKNSN